MGAIKLIAVTFFIAANCSADFDSAVIQKWWCLLFSWSLFEHVFACVQFVAATWLRAASLWGTVNICAPWTSRGFTARSATIAGNLWRVRWWRSWGRPTILPASSALFASTFKVPQASYVFDIIDGLEMQIPQKIYKERYLEIKI